MSESIKDQQRDLIYKAEVLGGKEIVMSNKIIDDEFKSKGLYNEGVLEPPYSAELLTTIYEQSSILPQCVEAMETNVDGFGFMLEAIDGIERQEDGKYAPEIEAERNRIKHFFEYCNAEESFTKIRKKTRRDYEVVGYAFWEVLRSTTGELAGIEHVPAYTMRLCRTDKEVVHIELKIKDEHNNFMNVPHARRFRKFIQIKDGIQVYFKEFGDPRHMNAENGHFLTKAEHQELLDHGTVDGKPARLATEIMYYRQYNPRTPYGVPRWMGGLPSVLGERAADDVNLNYFDNKAVPPMAVLVSGRLAESSKKVIEEHVEKNIKGRNNFHSILIIEVENPPNPMAGNQRASVELKPLTEAIQKDALFMEYTKQARNKVRSMYRLPPIYVGESQDYTKATAAESREVAEEQVFGPERDDFDFTINRVLFTEMGVKYWKFKSLSPTEDNSYNLAEIVEKLSNSGLTAREAREVMAEIFNKELPDPTDADWLDEPLQVFMAKLGAGMTPTQIEQAEARAKDALEQARLFSQFSGFQRENDDDEGEEGTQQGVRKAAGMNEFVKMLVEIRKQVLEHDEEIEGVPIRTY